MIVTQDSAILEWNSVAQHFWRKRFENWWRPREIPFTDCEDRGSRMMMLLGIMGIILSNGTLAGHPGVQSHLVI